MNGLAVIDGFGVYGNYVHFSFVVLFVGSAFLIFLYLWNKGRLDMDEEAKFQMMESNSNIQKEDGHHDK
jgi:hypothetical protein